MAKDDEEARKARAQRLREQIQEIAGTNEEDEAAEKGPQPSPTESPRDFVHRKMRELDQKDKG